MADWENRIGINRGINRGAKQGQPDLRDFFPANSKIGSPPLSHQTQIMPRRERCVVEGLPHHVTQRGVDRCPVFQSDLDRTTYLRLLADNLVEARTRVLGWCLMTNHIHLVILPQQRDSLALLLRRVHGRHAQYFNVKSGRTGHLWQNRYFACALGPAHTWRALAYVDSNPVRAGMVARAAEYPWSSAAAHICGDDPSRLLDLDWWQAQAMGPAWQDFLRDAGPNLGRKQGQPDLREFFANSIGASRDHRQPSARPRTARTGHSCVRVSAVPPRLIRGPG
jgi:putative transposase